MDSRARLDHAVFHLTPTRTRCDLVAFCGKSSEKLASGLLEPFVAHLQVAKDEISKGGYSITLRPPPNLDSYWFTKATFQRFVRFVSTPDTLERFVILEKEIQQIESSIQTDETATAVVAASDLDKAKVEGDVAVEVAKEENSKARLQRVFGSRLAILRREQAMAYQRALVLGFDLASIDDLLAFAGCFGASRLRDACINFKDLCVVKHNDSIWMNELAAVKAYAPPEFVDTPAIVLTSEIEPNTTDQVPSENGRGSMPWPGQYPPYMYNFHNPMQQGQRPYMMQPYPPYYPPNMQWSPNMVNSGHHHSRKSGSRKKGRSSDGTTSEEDSQSEATDSASDNDADEYKQNGRNYSSGERGSKKKHKKKSSKTVVIRNINYITSKHGEEGVEYDSSDNESQSAEKSGRKNGKLGKEGSFDYENAIETNGSGGNGSTETWGNFQNLLMRSKDLESEMVTKQDYSPYVNNSGMDMGGEKPRVQQRGLPADSFVPSNGYVDNGSGMSLEELESNKGFRPVMRRGENGGEDAIFSRGFEEHNGIRSDFASESAVNKIVKGEDWSMTNQSGLSKNQNGSIGHKSFDESYELTQGNKNSAESMRESFVDDSIMVQSHSVAVSQDDSHWKTDISMILDQDSAAKTNSGEINATQDKLEKRLSYEPDDMFFMPERDSALESSVASFTPKMDYGAEISFSRDQRKNSADETEDRDKEVPVKTPVKEAKPKPVPRYLSRNKPPEIKNKKPFSSKPAMQKSKQEREDEIRRKMEELVIERQKRIAERSAAAGTTPKKPAPKVATKSR